MARSRGEQNGWFVGSLGVILLLVATALAIENLVFLRAARLADGCVVANRREQWASKGRDVVQFTPAVEFTDLNGRQHWMQASHGIDSPLPLGSFIDVHYHPDDTSRARLGGEFLWRWPIGISALGGVFIIFGLLLTVGSRLLLWLGVPLRS
ncbi:MAG TPA: DUF3592 domain-containing protein [Pirellulaceae bacterium]|nr:DUF3592 domain-containing protein [Pirellulaceae bacterium]